MSVEQARESPCTLTSRLASELILGEEWMLTSAWTRQSARQPPLVPRIGSAREPPIWNDKRATEAIIFLTHPPQLPGANVCVHLDNHVCMVHRMLSNSKAGTAGPRGTSTCAPPSGWRRPPHSGGATSTCFSTGGLPYPQASHFTCSCCSVLSCWQHI